MSNATSIVHVRTGPNKTRYLSLQQSLFVASQTPLRRDVVLDHLGATNTSTNVTTIPSRVMDLRECKTDVKTSAIHSSFQCPELVHLFLQDISRLPNCHLHPSSTCTLPRRNDHRQEQLSQSASYGSIVPPCSSTEHEAWLLTEAGTWRWNKYPIQVATSLVQNNVPWNWKWNSEPSNGLFSWQRNPVPYIEIEMPECENGTTCVANTLSIRGLPRSSTSGRESRGIAKGISLCKYMYQDEWKRLPYVMPSKEPRPCLLCYWFYSTHLVINATSHPGLQVDRSNFFQLHYNLVDKVGGYKKQHMLYPLREQYLGFAHPLVHFQQEHLFAYRDEELNKWRISCKSMHHVDAPMVSPLSLSSSIQSTDVTSGFGLNRGLDGDRPETPSGYELSLGLSNMQLDSDMD